MLRSVNPVHRATVRQHHRRPAAQPGRVAAQCSVHRRRQYAADRSDASRVNPLVAGVAGLVLLFSDPLLQGARAEPAGSSVAPPAQPEVERPKLSALCKTAACKELIEQAEAIQQAREEGRPIPDFRPKTEEEKMARAGGPPAARRRLRYEREQQQARESALKKQEFARNEPAYIAKSQAELFEFKQALADGASTDEARDRAKKAGEAAFATAMADIDAVKAEQAAYEQRMMERRLAAAERARQEEAAAAKTAPATAGALK